MERGLVTINFNGKIMLLTEVANIVKIPYKNLYQRLFIHGWTIEKATTKPVQKQIGGNKVYPKKVILENLKDAFRKEEVRQSRKVENEMIDVHESLPPRSYRRDIEWKDSSYNKLAAFGMIVCRHCSSTASAEDNHCHVCGNIFRVNLMSGL